MKNNQPSIFKLKNRVMNYSWGSSTAIAELLGNPAPADTPEAELWMGAHPKAPSMILVDGNWISLIQGIKRDPTRMLGPSTAARFGNRLPYLFKVLAAARPLSIQAHPDKVQAEEGFSRENVLGIPIDAPQRNYRDDNHKPECICALTPFWALNGFRDIPAMISLLGQACGRTLSSPIARLEKTGNENGLKQFFKMLITLKGERKSAVLQEALSFARSNGRADQTFKWVAKLGEYYPEDIGILSPLLLNLICLEPGQAMYLPAGRLHAYLDGTGLEVMANSDNVLRGGLTAKHVDVDELLKVLRFVSTSIDPIVPRDVSAYEAVYDTPDKEFALSRITLKPGDSCRSALGSGARIILCTEGSVIVAADKGDEMIRMNRGDSVFIAGGLQAFTLSGEGTVFKTFVP